MVKKTKHQITTLRDNEDKIVLERLEAGLVAKINGKDINLLYKEKLANTLDIDEPFSSTLKQPHGRPPKPAKEPKVMSAKGKASSERLSKYREQVKEALALKKKTDEKLIYDADEDDDSDFEYDTPKPTQPIIAPPPPVNLDVIYSQIDELKKQNKELENKFIHKNDLMNVGNMRRNIMLKF